MSDLGFNKIAAGVLAAGLAITFMNQISEHAFEAPSVNGAKMGYKIIPTEGGSEAPAIVMPSPDWGTVLATADVAKGQDLFQKCGSCHKPTDENGTGPGLIGVLGRKPGTHVGTPAPFKYSDAMIKFGGTNPQWTFDLVEKFITKPQSFIDGTKMTFPGLKDQQDRINVIAYLHTLNSTLAVPKPDPARAAATAAALAGPAKAPAAGAAPAAGGAPAPAATSTPDAKGAASPAAPAPEAVKTK